MKGPSVAIHQPNFFPWLGYFHKIYLSDVFIFHDQVEYTKKSLIRRTQIRKDPDSAELTYLTVPLKHASDYTLISQLRIDHSQDWQKKALNQIRNAYRKAPYFELFYPMVADLFADSASFDSFSEFSIHCTLKIMEILGITSQTLVSSQLPVTGYKSAYNVNLVSYCGGKVYYSGTGARKYQTEDEFTQAGISLCYLDTWSFLESQMDKLPVGFNPRTSVLDSLFLFGQGLILKVFRDYSDLYPS